MPSQNGFISECPQRQSVTRLRVSNGLPSERWSGDAAGDPEGARGPRSSSVTAMLTGRSGSMSALSGVSEYMYQPDGQRSIRAMIRARTSLSDAPSIIAGIRLIRPTQNAACMQR